MILSSVEALSWERRVKRGTDLTPYYSPLAVRDALTLRIRWNRGLISFQHQSRSFIPSYIVTCRHLSKEITLNYADIGCESGIVITPKSEIPLPTPRKRGDNNNLNVRHDPTVRHASGTWPRSIRIWAKIGWSSVKRERGPKITRGRLGKVVHPKCDVEVSRGPNKTSLWGSIWSDSITKSIDLDNVFLVHYSQARIAKCIA